MIMGLVWRRIGSSSVLVEEGVVGSLNKAQLIISVEEK